MTSAVPNIPRYGHIAAALRDWLARNSKTPADLTAAMGLKPGSTSVYPWLNATGAPSPKFRENLARATGIPETDLMVREAGTAASPPAKVTYQPRGARPTGDVLAFSVTADGQARIRLDATLPLETAKPLLRMILDAGVVFGEV